MTTATQAPAAPATVASEVLYERRERVFLVLAGFFLCAMTLLNVVGITRFVQLGPMALAVGVLPYPLTFLCTDLISELYGRRRANFLVWVGFTLNFFILGVLWLGNALPAVSVETQPPWQVIALAEDMALPNGQVVSGSVELFQLLYACTSGAVFASMMAYIAAQYCDVQLFHFFKRLTKGKHLWLRNNFSTLTSQMVDSFMVITVTFGAVFLAGGISLAAMLVLMASNYMFKMFVAMADTLPFYYLTGKLKRYLEIDNVHVLE
ncbi:MAG: queuosine precursor transporter [Pseudomonadales bacterium]